MNDSSLGSICTDAYEYLTSEVTYIDQFLESAITPANWCCNKEAICAMFSELWYEATCGELRELMNEARQTREEVIGETREEVIEQLD